MSGKGNIIQLMGHLGGDPETRVTPNGHKVTSFSIATNSRRGGKDETTWFRVTNWHSRMGDSFERMLPYLKKGSALIVVGELDKVDIYTDRSGQSRPSLDVTADFVSFPPFGRQDKGEGQGEQRAAPYTQPAAAPASPPAFGNEDPFAGAGQPAFGQGTDFASQQTDENDPPF